jgi:hypothetical protein
MWKIIFIQILLFALCLVAACDSKCHKHSKNATNSSQSQANSENSEVILSTTNVPLEAYSTAHHSAAHNGRGFGRRKNDDDVESVVSKPTKNPITTTTTTPKPKPFNIDDFVLGPVLNEAEARRMSNTVEAAIMKMCYTKVRVCLEKHVLF